MVSLLVDNLSPSVSLGDKLSTSSDQLSSQCFSADSATLVL